MKMIMQNLTQWNYSSLITKVRSVEEWMGGILFFDKLRGWMILCPWFMNLRGRRAREFRFWGFHKRREFE